MTTKFNVGDTVYAEEGFEISYGTISKIEINKNGVYYYFDKNDWGYDESTLHRTEEETFIEMLKGGIESTTYYHKHNQQLENLRNELLEIIARYED